MKNNGLNLELEKLHRSQEDWVFGALSKDCIADIPESDRDLYLPEGERQNIGEEKMDCATRGPINILETKFSWLYANHLIKEENRKWLRERGYVNAKGKIEFSDRFIAVLSGTDPALGGNSLKAPIDAIHTYGLIPKSMLPQCESQAEYYDKSKITPLMMSLGEESKSRFPINYEIVYDIHFKELLKDDMIDVAGHAWVPPVDGEYKRVENPPNHCFIIYKTPAYYAFDNYIDVADGDYVKKLAPDYDMLDYGYRLIVSEAPQAIVEKPQGVFWKRVLQWLRKQNSIIKWFYNEKSN